MNILKQITVNCNISLSHSRDESKLSQCEVTPQENRIIPIKPKGFQPSSALGNTELNSHRLSDAPQKPYHIDTGIDFLCGTGKCQNWADLTDLQDGILTKIFGFVCDLYEKQQGGRKVGHEYFTDYWKSTRGAFVAAKELDNGTIRYYVSIPGKVCQSAGLFNYARLHCYVGDLDFTPTRIDTQITDYTKSLPLEQIEEWLRLCEKEGVRHYSGFRDWKPHGTFPSGLTLRLGSLNADSFTILYDKSKESKGEIDAYRAERRWGGEDARRVFRELYILFGAYLRDGQSEATTQLLLVNLKNLAISGIDFIWRKDKNLSRATRLPWWQKFLDFVGAAPVKFPPIKVITSIDKKLKWFSRSVEKSLAMVEKYLGDAFIPWLQARRKSGTERMTDFDWKMIESQAWLDQRVAAAGCG